jgi:4-amino-4-deoxy-L-arabinose transferase-like glycosyltransferase
MSDSLSFRHGVLWALVLIGLAVRIGAAAALTGLDTPPKFGSDQYEYDNYAWNVAQGLGYRGISPDVADPNHLTAYRPPGTSLTFAGVYTVFGHRYAWARLLNCAVGALTILLVYNIGRRCFGEPVGLLAAMAFAVYPPSLVSSIELASEPLGTFWFLASTAICLRLSDRPTWGLSALAGLLLGAAILTRPNFLIMVPLLGLWAVWQFWGRWLGLAMALVVPAVAVATLAPWAGRNYQVFGQFIPISTMGGSVLLQGNNRLVLSDPELLGYSIWDTDIPEYTEALRSAGDEVERDRRARQFAVQWLKDNPDQWLPLLRAKFVRAWSPFLQLRSPKLYRIGVLLTWGPVLILFSLSFIPTLATFLRIGHPGWLIHLGILHHAILSEIFFGNARYRSVIEPLCLILASWSVVFGFAWVRGRLLACPSVEVRSATRLREPSTM